MSAGYSQRLVAALHIDPDGQVSSSSQPSRSALQRRSTLPWHWPSPGPQVGDVQAPWAASHRAGVAQPAWCTHVPLLQASSDTSLQRKAPVVQGVGRQPRMGSQPPGLEHCVTTPQPVRSSRHSCWVLPWQRLAPPVGQTGS